MLGRSELLEIRFEKNVMNLTLLDLSPPDNVTEWGFTEGRLLGLDLAESFSLGVFTLAGIDSMI